jgi:hypothetical protein
MWQKRSCRFWRSLDCASGWWRIGIRSATLPVFAG